MFHFGFEEGMLKLIVSVPDHCLYILLYFCNIVTLLSIVDLCKVNCLKRCTQYVKIFSLEQVISIVNDMF